MRRKKDHLAEERWSPFVSSEGQACLETMTPVKDKHGCSRLSSDSRISSTAAERTKKPTGQVTNMPIVSLSGHIKMKRKDRKYQKRALQIPVLCTEDVHHL
ncbi:hypothetical protein SKAU_G00165100 [Synaphobranchus kaupii]|uniref:Uncharacterized protein n=1 Tax=Synaphobranchus kaupii TaxID=118154 RepID=A0A9Q1J051_SYNKA|nr:hypothetical protein SKAU_G00165100 [Synaphobranchus kaupii]